MSVRSYSRYSETRSEEIDTGRPGRSSSAISRARRSWAGFTYALRNAIVSDSVPDASRSSIAARVASSSMAVMTSPEALVRSGTPRVSHSGTSGSGLIMPIHAYSGPGVHARARWRICSWPAVVSRPPTAPFSSRIMFVTTVDPCRMSDRASSPTPCVSHACLTPAMTPSDWSSGVDSTFAIVRSPVSSDTSSTSVNVPPTSTPSLRLICPPASGRARQALLAAASSLMSLRRTICDRATARMSAPP